MASFERTLDLLAVLFRLVPDPWWFAIALNDSIEGLFNLFPEWSL